MLHEPDALMSLFKSAKQIADDAELSDEEKKKALTRLFIETCSMGDLNKIQYLLKHYSEFIDKNGIDEGQSSALIYATCFGHEKIVSLLISESVNLNQQDSNGWTALLWACANKHAQIAKMLIEAGGDQAIQTTSGRSLKELAGSSSQEPDLIYLLNLDNEAQIQDSSAYDHLNEPKDDRVFDWDSCSLDQMIVFDVSLIDKILNVAIKTFKPYNLKSKQPIPANIMFLCSRYASYYHSPDLVETLFEESFAAMLFVINESKNDLLVIAYWISICTQLLHYMKKDAGLVVSTFSSQLSLSEFIQELCQLFFHQIKSKLKTLIPGGLLDYSPYPMQSQVQFENSFSSISRQRSLYKAGSQFFEMVQTKASQNISPVVQSINNAAASANRSSHTKSAVFSPKIITNLLSTCLMSLRYYQIHPSIQQFILEQIFHFLGAEMFNQILSNRDRCCRSRAVTMRMNLCSIEEWLKENLGDSEDATERTHSLVINKQRQILLDQLKPVIHLTQFLQVLSSMTGLREFLTTMKSLDGISISQSKKAIEMYKYEVGESTVCEKIEEYVDKVELDRSSKTNFGNNSGTSSANSSVCGDVRPVKHHLSTPEKYPSEYNHDDDYHEKSKVFMDTEYTVPFQLPSLGNNPISSGESITNSASEWPGTLIAPFVPEEFMNMIY